MEPALIVEHKKTKHLNSNVLECIRTRRAVRAYSRKVLDNDTIVLLLDAANWAPSAMNLQPWCFAIIQNRALLQQINQEAKDAILNAPLWKSSPEKKMIPLTDPNFDIFYGASTLIVICAKTSGFEPTGDAYFAGQNLMLAAHSIGLGTCPIGFARDVLQRPHFRKDLSIPKDFVPVLPIAVGYPLEFPKQPKREAPHIVSWLR